MAKKTGISWCDSTFNPWIGCSKISPGCDNCYAEHLMDHRMGRVKWGPGNPRSRTSAAYWKQPLRWEREYEQFFAEHRHRRRVFCASLADVFDNEIDPAWRADLWTLICDTPHLIWLILTKRIDNAPAMLPFGWKGGYYHNVWLGITVANQEEADRDIPKLLAIPARVQFLSCEPMLGSIDISTSAALVDPSRFWVICGGESGPNFRPVDPIWVDDLRWQCHSSDVPFFFKQWGGTAKDKGGCLLGGMEHKAWP